MMFSDIVTDIKNKVKDVQTSDVASIKASINHFYLRLWQKNNWWFARREFVFNTVAKYETGTVTVTQNNATVTGSGTAWTSDMVGRKFMISDNTQSYKILSVTSGTVLILDTVYQDTTKSSQAYGIYKDTYLLDDRITKVLWMRQNYTPCRVREFPERHFDEWMPNVYDTGEPSRYIPRGQTTTPIYSTGTVTVTNASATVTGSGTVWDSSLTGHLFKCYGDGNEYVVSNVTNASSLTLNRVYNGTSVSALSYAIGPAGIEQVQLWPMPDVVDVVVQIWYKGQQRPVKLLNDTDIPELPEQWHHILVEGGYATYIVGHESEARIKDAREQAMRSVIEMIEWHNATEDENPTFQDNLEDLFLTSNKNAWVFRE